MRLKLLLSVLSLSLLSAIVQAAVVRPSQAIVSFTLDDLPVISGSSSAEGALGSAFNHQITGAGPATYTATGLPPGLSISSSGLISGTPATFGNFTVNLTATNANGSSSTQFSLNISPWPVSSSTANAVGATAGALSVDSSGAAVYDLPIFAPPGVGGVEPHLALKYSSNGANGLLGVGWSLSGLSMITRGASSKELYASDTDSLPVDAVTPAIYPLFNNPTGLAVSSTGLVYVADTSNHVIRTIDTNGASAVFAGSVGVSGSVDGVGGSARFNAPQGLALDSSGNLYVADYGNHKIRKITPSGVVTTFAGSGLSGLVNGTGTAARFKHPIGVAVNSAGTVFVADTENNQIRTITTSGVVTLFAGSTSGVLGSTDATGTAARFESPHDIALDSAGSAYVADTGNNMIRKITTGGAVTTLAGAPDTFGSADGTGSAARFDFPDGLVVDSSGNVFVTDGANHTVRKITSAGVVTTFAGSARNAGYVDAVGTAARFNHPSEITVDGSGNILVADYTNNLIRKVTPAGVVTTFGGVPGLLNLDRYFLDGNRLEVVSGTYGENNSEYRTSVETFSRIICHNDGTNPAWFEVWTKDGLKMEFGNVAEARVGGTAPAVGAWLLNRVQDLAGNYLDVSYTVTDDSLTHFPYPNEIKYTGNGTVAPTNSVKFTYELRPNADKIRLKQTGVGSVDILHRLKTVSSLSGATTVRSYTLTYDTSVFTQRSRLTEVQEAGISGTTLPKTTFTWPSPATTDTNSFSSATTGTLGNSGDSLHAGDFNGDGKTDVLRIGSTSARSTQLYLSTGSALSTANAPAAFNLNSNFTSNGGDRLLVGDITGDGLPDIVATLVNYTVINSTTVRMTVRRKVWITSVSGGTVSFFNPTAVDASPPDYTVSGTFTAPPAPLERLLDIDGSGKAVLFTAQSGYFVPNNQWAAYKWNSATNVFDYQTGGLNGFRAEDDIRPIDANGDGVADLWLPKYDASGGRIVVNYTPKYTTSLNFEPSKSNFVLGDFNGDRLTDGLDLQLVGGAQRMQWAFPTASVAFTGNYDISGSAVSDWSAQRISAVDLNRDGRDDLIIQRAASCEFSYARGDTTNPVAFSTPVTITGGPLSNETVMPIDFNGDGRTDLLVRGNPSAGNNSTSFKVLVASGTSPSDVITKVTNGFGATVDVTYAPLTDATVYTKGTATPAGLIDLQTPIQVVKTVTCDLGGVHSTTPTTLPAAAGTAASYTQTYKYEGLRSAPYRGVVGFAAQEVTDSRTGVTTRVERRQDSAPANYAYNGFVTRTLVKRGTVILADSVVTPALLSLNSGKTSLAYAQTATAKTWDISSTLTTQGSMTSNQTVTQTLDSWGNPTSVVTTAGFGGRTTTQTNTYYAADTTAGRWWISRLQTNTTLQQATGETDVTRAADYYYRDNDANAINDAQGTPLQVTKAVAFPSDAAKKLTTVYTYGDAFGHLTKLELTGKKDASTDQTRTVAYAYDASGRFLITITHTGSNGNLVEDYIPDALHGAPGSHTDANGQTTLYDYDDFCRLISTTSPTNVITTSSLAWQTDTRGIYSVETHATFLDSDGLTKEVAPPSFTVFDRLGRAVRQETMTADGAAVTRMETLYNTIGAAWATSTPVRSGDAVYWNQVAFDALGRTQTQTNANGGAASIVYNGTEITTTATGDYNSTTITKKARTVRDLQGRITNIYKNEDLGTAFERDSVNYLYDAAGNLKQTTAAGVVTGSTYDVRGLPVTLTDPNTGASSSLYNAFGEVYSTTDAKIQTITMDYDILGRLITRTEDEGTTTWTYDDATGKGLGRLHSVSGPDGGGGTYTETYTYDVNFSRVALVQKTINGRTCTTVMGYDGASRMASVTYQVPSFADQQFRYLYNNLGALREVRDMSVPSGPTQGTTMWSLGSVSVYGQPVDETFGNGVTSWTGYRATDGMLEKRRVSTGGTYLENLKLGLDPFGNVRRRELCSDAAQNSVARAEDYGIDLLDRLTSVKLNNTTSLTVSYDTQGNITNKSDVGNYSYSMIGAGPHAVTTAGGTTHGYDANGNLTKRNGTTENSWTSFDQPLTIVRNGTTSTFRYGPDRQRIQQVTGVTGAAAADQTITRYFGGGMEHVVQDRTTTCRYAVFTPGGRVAEIAVVSLYGETTRTTSYFASDHLGSVEAVTDAQGNVLEQLSYNAWGQRRNADWTPGTPARSSNVNRGYTDHEMLDGPGLVHMNGRVYDPVLARFLRSDPVVSDPMSAQTYNGYSYVGNNPLAATDPSGYVIRHSFSTGGSNYGNYNFNTGGGSSNSFSFMGGTFSFSIGGGGYDPFENRFSSGNSAMIGMQARYMSLFGASSVFTGIPSVTNASSYLSTANSGRGGNSSVQNIGYSTTNTWSDKIRAFSKGYSARFQAMGDDQWRHYGDNMIQKEILETGYSEADQAELQSIANWGKPFGETGAMIITAATFGMSGKVTPKYASRPTVRSPNNPMRANANFRPSFQNPRTNKLQLVSQRMPADHIIPQEWIRQQPGFDRLTPAQQDYILNHPLNTQGLPTTFNSSKGSLQPDKWQTHLGQPLDPIYMDSQILRAQFLRGFIQQKIIELNTGNGTP